MKSVKEVMAFIFKWAELLTIKKRRSDNGRKKIAVGKASDQEVVGVC